MDEEFGQFVAARGRALCRTAYLLTGDWQVGEDLVQEALTRTYLRRRRLRSAAALEPYARKVLVSLFRSSRRRHWHRELPFADVPDQAANDQLAAVDDRSGLWPALPRLSAQQRAVLVLVEVTARGPKARLVLETLTRSPRSVVLARGAAPLVPAGWRWHVIGGIRFASPGGWKPEHTDEWGSCSGRPVLRGIVQLSTARIPACRLVGMLPSLANSCACRPGSGRSRPARDP